MSDDKDNILHKAAGVMLNAGAIAIDTKRIPFTDTYRVSGHFMRKLAEALRNAGFDIDTQRKKAGRNPL